MVVFGESWNPSETVRLTARILAKQVGKCDNAQLHSFIKGQKDGCRARLSMWLRILGASATSGCNGRALKRNLGCFPGALRTLPPPEEEYSRTSSIRSFLGDLFT